MLASVKVQVSAIESVQLDMHDAAEVTLAVASHMESGTVLSALALVRLSSGLPPLSGADDNCCKGEIGAELTCPTALQASAIGDRWVGDSEWLRLTSFAMVGCGFWANIAVFPIRNMLAASR